VVLTLFSDLRQEGEDKKGRRYILWRITRDLEKSLVENFMEKIRANVQTSFYAKHAFGSVLEHIEDGSTYIRGLDKPRLALVFSGFLTQNFGSNSKKRNVWTLTTYIALQPNGCLKSFSGLISRLFLTASHFLEQAPCPTGCEILHAVGTQCFVWTLFGTTYAFGGVLPCIKEPVVTEAPTLPVYGEGFL